MKVDYDVEVDVLSWNTGMRPATSAALLDDTNIVVDLAEADGHNIVGLAVMGASKYLSQGRDTPLKQIRCFRAKRTPGPTLITEHSDFIGDWQVDDEPDSFMDPVGLLIRNALKHLAPGTANYTLKTSGG